MSVCIFVLLLFTVCCTYHLCIMWGILFAYKCVGSDAERISRCVYISIFTFYSFALFVSCDDVKQFLALFLLVGVVGYGTVDNDKQHCCDGYLVHLCKFCKVVQYVKECY